MADLEESGRETSTEQEPTSLQWKCLDFGWLVYTWPGRFKSMEFITTFLGFVLISSVNVFDQEPRYEFYVFVGVFSWVMVFVHMLLGIPHLIEKLPAVITQPLVFLMLCSIAVLCWLIAACLVVSKDRNDSTVQAGAAFGFMSMFLFFFEALYYFVGWRRGVSSSTTTTTSTNNEMKDAAAAADDDDYVAEDPGY